jgi:putative alpha-1,2-mannosidase
MKTNNRIKWMISLSFILFIPSTNIAQNAGQAPQTNYAQMVDTRIGSKGNGLSCGFTYIGASYPFGMMQFFLFTAKRHRSQSDVRFRMSAYGQFPGTAHQWESDKVS